MKFFAICVLSALVILTNAENPPKCSPSEKHTGTLSDAAFWAGVDGGKQVEQLTDENHDTFIKENDKVFVMYYHPGCPHCKNCKKAFAGAAKKLNKGDVKIIAAVDCTSPDSATACEKATGYPTFILYKSEEPQPEYTGKRTTDAFVKYVNSKQFA